MIRISYLSGGVGLSVGIVFIGIVVIEGAIGIRILISTVASFGEDHFFRLSVS